MAIFGKQASFSTKKTGKSKLFELKIVIRAQDARLATHFMMHEFTKKLFSKFRGQEIVEF